MESFEEKVQKEFWYMGFAVIAISFFIVITKRILGLSIENLLPECLLWKKYGWYCPGCGGTRAVIQLMHGCIWKSFLMHPVVPYVTAIFILFMVTSTCHYVFGYHRRFLLRPIYFYVTIGIILSQWIIKNILLCQGLQRL